MPQQKLRLRRKQRQESVYCRERKRVSPMCKTSLRVW